MNKAPHLRTVVQLLLYGLCAVMAGVCLYPVSTRLTRAATLFIAAALWLCVFCLLWPRPKLRLAPLTLAFLLLAVCMMPGRPHDAPKLRAAYTAALKRYEGATYWWGGENAVGIDCSGLVRKALVIANLKHGLLCLNGACVREGLWLWWHDCTARTLGSGYTGRTHLVLEAPSINELDCGPLLPGDLAVTSGGVHVLAFLGDRTWIQADPTAAKVVIAPAPSHTASYYQVPVKIIRWRQLEGCCR